MMWANVREGSLKMASSSVQPFFSQHVRMTNTQTDTTSEAIGCVYAMLAMRPNDSNNGYNNNDNKITFFTLW